LSDDNSIKLTSSDEDNYNNLFDTDCHVWCDVLENISEFTFDSSHSELKIDMQETARNNPVEIFELFWNKEIFEITVKSTNNYDKIA